MLPAPPPPSVGGAAVWLAAFALLFGAFVVFAGSPHERKAHFWLRVLALALVPGVISAILIVAGELRVLPDRVAQTLLLLLVFLTIPGVMIVPALLYRRPGPSTDSSEEDGGGGRGPEQPPARPTPPRGGVPLQDAEQSRTRLRDAHRRASGRIARRPAREPDRSPVRAPSQR